MLPVVVLQETDFPDSVETGAARESGDDVVSDERIQKLTVVLDLDETLVCAYETFSVPLSLRNQATEAGLKWFETLSLNAYLPTREYREHVKDLSCRSKDLCCTVIVDNDSFSFLLQPFNGIPCIPLSASQQHDNQKDVRPLLYENFHMPQ